LKESGARLATVPTIEPSVSFEKLGLLLAEGHESEHLDYKETCDLSQTRDTVELAKDVGAMQVLGGYIVVGADDTGKPTAGLSDEQAVLFDESRLRAKMRKYLPEPLVLLSAVHAIDGSRIALVYVGPNPKGMAVFSADGQHGANQVVFRRGDIFVRHGTASDRCQQSDLDRIFEQAISTRKEEWRRELGESLQEVLERGRRAQDLAGGPAEALDWRLDAETFVGIVTEQLRREDEIPLRLATDRMVTDALAFHSVGAHDELATVLDRFACLAGLFVQLERTTLLERIFAAIVRVYAAAIEPSPTVTSGADAALWLEISERLEAIGGFAVRREQWSSVRAIALLKTPGRDPYYVYLLRHTVISAGRDGLLEPQAGQAVQLVSLGASVARRLTCLRPDAEADDERILNSICQFDALAAIAAMGESGIRDPEVFFTSFAYYYAHRTEPALRRLISDGPMRAAIFPGTDDELASALWILNRWARQPGFQYSGWFGFDDQTILNFLKAHPPEQSAP
jgi:hypothetical protein